MYFYIILLYITALGYPVFTNKTLVINYKDSYFKID